MAEHLLGAEGLRLSYPTREVFDSVTLGVSAGDRVGIVGSNGDGKSSLLAMLAGQINPQAGRVTRRSGVRMGSLTQRDELDEQLRVGEAIVGTRPEHEWAADARIRQVLAGLVADIDWQARVGQLSGGQRRRVALAALLVGDWDILTLDEPTNHLDMEAIAWLARHLQTRWATNAGALLVITHDRWFLDEVCTQTWEVHDRLVEPFEGGYAAYVLQRLERDRVAAATEQKRQNLLRKELAWLRRGAPARTSKPKFRIDAANELIAQEPPVRNPLELQRLSVARLGKDVVDLQDVSVSYGHRQVLRQVNWHLAAGERTGILAPNGAGKTTLLGLISGQVQPTSGRVKRGKTVRIGLLDQQFSQLAQMGPQLVREVLAATKTTFTIEGKDFTPAQLLQRLGFAAEHLSSRVNELSGGQKRRLQLLLLLLAEPNVILLDEPTNDVDAQMLAAMEDLLDSWPGTLIVVSHDRYLLERVTDQQYAIWEGQLRHLPGGVEQYLQLSAAVKPTSASPADSAIGPDGSAVASAGPSGAQLRAVQKELAALERRLEKLSTQIGQAHQKMATHEPGDYAGLAELTDKVRVLEAEQAQTEQRWLELSEQLEV